MIIRIDAKDSLSLILRTSRPTTAGSFFGLPDDGLRKVKQISGDKRHNTMNIPVRYFLVHGLSAMVLFAVGGCSGGGGPKPVDAKQVYPVSGIVHIDGEPKPHVKIKLVPDPMPSDGKIQLPILGRTNDEGKFSLTTYYQDDGAPVGEYRLLFLLDLNPAGSANDYFKGKYQNPTASEVKLSVTGKEESIDMGIIELKSP